MVSMISTDSVGEPTPEFWALFRLADDFFEQTTDYCSCHCVTGTWTRSRISLVSAL